MAVTDYSKYGVSVPIREVGANMKVKGITFPTYTYLSNAQVPNCNIYLEVSWVYAMPDPPLVIPAVHAHPYEQITMLIGSDPFNPQYLGGEVESTMGGQVTTTHLVSNYPGFEKPVEGFMLTHFMTEQAKHAGVDFRQAVEVAAPYGVDVSGGVEAAPGIKDPEKIKRFIREAKGC